MKIIAALLLSFLVTTSLLAAETINWNDFNRAFSTKATYQETTFGLFATLKRREVINEVHDINYFSAIGGFNDNNDFIASRYEIASEKWQKIDDTLHVDQWLFVLNTNHVLTFKLHRKMIQTLNGTVIMLENIEETEEDYAKKSSDILESWVKAI